MGIGDILQSICECSKGVTIPNKKLAGLITELGFPDEVLVITFDHEEAQQGGKRGQPSTLDTNKKTILTIGMEK